MQAYNGGRRKKPVRINDHVIGEADSWSEAATVVGRFARELFGARHRGPNTSFLTVSIDSVRDLEKLIGFKTVPISAVMEDTPDGYVLRF